MPLYQKPNHNQATLLSTFSFACETDFLLTRPQVGQADSIAQIGALNELWYGQYDVASAADADTAEEDGGNESAYRGLLGAVKDAVLKFWKRVVGGGAPQ